MSAVSVSESGVRPILADAVDLARRALLELEPSGVGAHLGVIAEDESAATHRFEATLPGYRGWQWAVVVAAPPGAGYATVSESALLPGPDALVAPEFVPWEQRVRPGDLAPGDLLAPPADDPRLVPGYVATGDPVVDEVAYEVGLGRTKVMSREGREEAAERWYAERGPDAEMAKAAPATCGSCGFYLPLAGSLRAAFGVCGNAMGADGRVVHVAYGCGAHSDTEVPTGNGSPLYEAYDDAAIDLISLENDQAPKDVAGAPASAGDRFDTAAQTEGATATAEVGAVAAEGAEIVGDAEGRAVVAEAAADIADATAVEGSERVDAAVDQDAPVRRDPGIGEASAVPENIAGAQTSTAAASAAGDEHPGFSADAAVADTGVAPEAVAAPDAIRAQRTTEEPAVTERVAADEGVGSTENGAVADELTVESTSATDAQPADSTATDTDAVSAAEVGEIDTSAAFTESSVPPAARTAPSADAPAVHDSTSDAAAGATIGAVDEQSVAKEDTGIDPALGSGDAADTPAAAGESGSSIADRTAPLDTQSSDVSASNSVEFGARTGPVEAATDQTGDTESPEHVTNVEEHAPGSATDVPVAEPGDTGPTVDNGPGERSEYQSSPRS
ncbi:DUF3027 domain-containing protein [Nocardia sputorum]|uniref:DUF3027 domain-containing protein n=1 Tax=Nocardia sputorum TaxID=2984338 RepID=UPI00248F667C|nr:DUF3027 domain-containing protein [Nocardia sputorum]